MRRYVILGCGYTGERVARRLLERGADLTIATREPWRLKHLEERGAAVVMEAPCDEARVLYSIPPPTLIETTGAERVVYISSTGVYGATEEVDETTPVAPATDMGRLRERAELGVGADLILRSCGIYGPGRGVHERIRQGVSNLVGDGTNVVSRIQVDDLAAICLAALDLEVTGAYPVADDRPATTHEVAMYVRTVMGQPFVRTPDQTHETLRFTRRVDGRAIRKLLGVELRYPTYKDGLDVSWFPGVVFKPTDSGFGAYDPEGACIGRAEMKRVGDDVAEFDGSAEDPFVRRALIGRLFVDAHEQGIARMRMAPADHDFARWLSRGEPVYEFDLPWPKPLEIAGTEPDAD